MKKKLPELTPLQFHVTQENGTERPFDNIYWNHFEEGLYVDLISNIPLFLSTHKFESSCGWPSFSAEIDKELFKFVEDHTYGMKRVEVRGLESDSHLGHIFDDGPAPSGKRYCINSAAIKFIPKKDFTSLGFDKFLDQLSDIP